MFMAISLTFIVMLLLAILMACAAIWVLTTFWSVSIVFARLIFSLLIASSVQYKLVFTEGKMNLLIWTGIIFGAICLVSMLPRVNIATKFFCTLFIAMLSTEIVIFIGGSFIAMIFKQEFVMTTLFEIIMKVVCTAISLGMMYDEIETTEYGKYSNKIVSYFEKIVSALVYGASVTFLCASMNGNWEFAVWIHIAIMLGAAVAAYFADKVLIGAE